jgi:hypothetical protein
MRRGGVPSLADDVIKNDCVVIGRRFERGISGGKCGRPGVRWSLLLVVVGEVRGDGGGGGVGVLGEGGCSGHRTQHGVLIPQVDAQPEHPEVRVEHARRQHVFLERELKMKQSSS